MKILFQKIRRSRTPGILLFGALLSVLIGCSDSTPKPAVAAVKPALVKTNLLQLVQTNVVVMETNAVFENNPTTRRDPFYPGSSRTSGAKGTVAQVKPRIESVLTLKSIIGTGVHRCAGINNRTFSIGETASVRLPSGDLLRVHCIDIGERSVVVTAEGEQDLKTLKLNQ